MLLKVVDDFYSCAIQIGDSRMSSGRLSQILKLQCCNSDMIETMKQLRCTEGRERLVGEKLFLFLDVAWSELCSEIVSCQRETKIFQTKSSTFASLCRIDGQSITASTWHYYRMTLPHRRTELKRTGIHISNLDDQLTPDDDESKPRYIKNYNKGQ